MEVDESENSLLEDAVKGDSGALERLLLGRHRQLLGHVRGKIPSDVVSIVAPEDVLQAVYVEVFRQIDSFEQQGIAAFSSWLRTIADHRLQDMIRSHRAAKRGGGRVNVDRVPATPDDSINALVEVVARDDRTPSLSMARREMQSAMRVALGGLKDEYREAIQLRHIDGLSPVEVAARMKRSKQAVHMLCQRGMKQLRLAMGRASLFFSRK
jgi:RNA polymerase sigma-70 factor (subfamily 1)